MVLFGGILSITKISFLVFCVFLIAGLGYLLGRITIKGVSLGTAGVFIVALLFGAFLYNPLAEQLKVGDATYVVNALKIVENLGLILFVTSVGFIAGPNFFGDFKRNFKSYIVLGLLIILVGGISCWACTFFDIKVFGRDAKEAAAMLVGLLYGSLTSTPAFSAAKATVATEELEAIVAVGHGIAYLFGVVGVVLFVQLVPKFSKANMEEERAKLSENNPEVPSKLTGKELELDGFGFCAFSIVAVDDNGNECGEDAKRNLGLRFALPKYQNNIVLNISGDKNSINTDINSLLNVYGDIAYVEMDKLNPFIDNLKERYDKIDCIDSHLIIPRMINEKPENDIDALKQVLYKRFGEEEFNKYKLHFGTGEDKEYYQAEDEYKIYFQQHLSSKDGGMSSYCKYAYADSVSGGNFTLTLSEIASRWDGNDNYEILKIKESALTRITLIDERLYDKMKRQGAETELSCKNIRVLNYKEPESQADESIMKLFIGNKFNRGGDATHFLSIHLGLVEKIIKDSTFFNSMTDENGEKYSAKSPEARTTALMRLLKECFGPKVFISVHSGRGNFSAELEGPLSVYPFISMAAIENTYDNSKYLLCQLFYSTIYLGKGVANKES